MTIAAGILFIAQGKALFLKRGNGGDHPLEWCFPGGRLEEGESLEQCAVRETQEEVGYTVGQSMEVWTRRKDAEGVDFTTFMHRLDEPFDPVLCDEHEGYVWADVNDPPLPLHPGCVVALNRLTMTELDVARAIQAGELTSPQRVGRMSLFAIRITGTGTAYRSAHNEFVYRRPENYLTDEFLARCNGLAVIFEHPEDAMLNSEEFAKRVVGTVLLPYILGDEVWAIARIYDDATVELLGRRQLSTSPGIDLTPDGVPLSDSAEHKRLSLDGGATLLIEGNPALIDHIAICAQGVWDKGGDPAGVVSETSGVVQMTEEEKAAAAAKAKADADEKEAKEKADAEAKAKADAEGDPLKKIADSMTSLCDSVAGLAKRMDAMEGDRKDADEEKAKEEKEKADAASKADSEKTAAAIADLNRRIPAILSEADRTDLANTQHRADSIGQLFGKPVTGAINGETPIAYRQRMAGQFKAHSTRCKDLDLTAINDSVALSVIEDEIYAAAKVAAMKPSNITPGVLMRHERADATGRRIATFTGDPQACWAPFRMQGRVAKMRSNSELQARN